MALEATRHYDLVQMKFATYLIFLAVFVPFSTFYPNTEMLLAKEDLKNPPVVPPKKVLLIGDSIGEGFGIAPDKNFVSILEIRFKQKFGTPLKIINGSVSGATSASALPRLKWFEQEKPDWVILELGGNDFLRGLKPDETKKNLRLSIEWCQSRKIRILLAAMKVPLNYGQTYRKNFEALYVQLSQQLKIPLLPFLLEGVGGVSKMNQADGIHPNEMGHEIVASNVERVLFPLLVKK